MTFLGQRSEEFRRDGEQLAARMTGRIKVEGVDTAFESFCLRGWRGWLSGLFGGPWAEGEGGVEVRGK